MHFFRVLIVSVFAFSFSQSGSAVDSFQGGIGVKTAAVGVTIQRPLTDFHRWSLGYYHGFNDRALMDLDWQVFMTRPNVIKGGPAAIWNAGKGFLGSINLATHGIGAFTGFGLEGELRKSEETHEHLHPKIPVGLEYHFENVNQIWQVYLANDIVWHPEEGWLARMKPTTGVRFLF